MPSHYRADVIRTYVDKVTTESFLQVLYERRFAVVLLQQHEVLYPHRVARV